MGNCCEYTKKDKQVAHIRYRRGCTDLLWFLVWAFGWVVFVYIQIMAQNNGGDPQRLIRGVDWQGNICGISPATANRPYAALPIPTNYKIKYCVASCDETDSVNSTFMIWRYKTFNVLNYCVPDILPNISTSITVKGDFQHEFESAQAVFGNAVGDLQNSWRVLLASAGFAVAVTFLFVFLLRYVAGLVIWTCILLLIAAGFMLGNVLINRSKTVDQTGSYSEERGKMMYYSGVAAFVATVLFILIIFALRRQISIAIEVVKEAARAIGDMKFVVLFPVFPLIAALCYMALWVWFALYLYSVSTLQTFSFAASYGTSYNTLSGDNGWSGTGKEGSLSFFSDKTDFQRFIFNDEFRVYGIIHFFHMLWQTQFLFYFGYLTVAGALANWYFTPRNESGRKVRGDGEYELPYSPVWQSMQRTLHYHLGTVALASLLLAIVKLVRAIIHYIESLTKTANGKQPNRIQTCILGCLSCCFKCVECCLDKCSKQALVWTAIWGDSFLTASCSSFQLIWRNLARVAALNAVSAALLVIGKITVALVVAGVGCYAITNVPEYADPIYSPVIPTLVMFLIGYVVASLFMMVFDTAIDTIFLCFLVDCEHNGNGDEGYMLASKELQKLVGKYKSESKDAADKMQDPYGDKAAAAAEDDGAVKMGEGGEGGYAQPRGAPARGQAASGPKSALKGGRAAAGNGKAQAAGAERPAAARPAAKRGGGGGGARRPAGKAAAKGGARPRQRMVQRPIEMELEDEPRGRRGGGGRDGPMRMEL